MRPETVSVDAGSDGPVLALGAVLDDVRHTLRMAWLDPGIEATARHPVFFAAAWSAIRPNVGRSFLTLARALRGLAVDSIRSWGGPPGVEERLESVLTDEELRRVTDTARAVHASAAKVQIVLHALHRAARRERIGGTGQEEPSVRRGVPDWQRWMAVSGAPDPTTGVLRAAKERMATPGAPAALGPFSRWPAALEAVWDGLAPSLETDAWRRAAAQIRRGLLSGVAHLPHPVDLQWPVLRERGFGEEARLVLEETLAAHEAAAPGQTLAAAFVWLSLGGPELGAEG
jgi:hypothetical protein